MAGLKGQRQSSEALAGPLGSSPPPLALQSPRRCAPSWRRLDEVVDVVLGGIVLRAINYRIAIGDLGEAAAIARSARNAGVLP